MLLGKGAAATTRTERKRQRQRCRLPDGFRHETLSAQLVEHLALLTGSREQQDLVLHLIASHHGFCRPLAPVVDDQDLPAVHVPAAVLGKDLRITSTDRAKWLPAERLDSGIAERFWRLSRRYGWWGLVYLEAVLRLADWQASEQEQAKSNSVEPNSNTQQESNHA